VSEYAEAFEITLRKLRPRAPYFHRYITKGKLVGSAWQAGDKVVVYEIVSTVPEGRVLVTDKTVLRFE
jgi:hypothetical protein